MAGTERNSVFLYNSELEKYAYPPESPFKTRRATLARKTVLSMGLLGGRAEQAPPPATRQELETFHAAAYLDAMLKAEQGDLSPEALHMGLGTLDCPVFRGMAEYAALAAGASMVGARLLLSGEADVAFNPSGGYHHAGPALASGFCYINDIVLACMRFRDAGKRVFFLDLDVHHCDGVQRAFYNTPDVMTVSMHEDGRTLFPGTGFVDEIGHGPGRGYSVNIPLPAGTYDGIYLDAFHSVVMPLLKAYSPDVIIVEAGMDGLAGDPLAHLSLTNNIFIEVLREIMGFGKPLLVTGGGGYNVENTVRGWALVWATLCGENFDHAGIGMGGVMLGNTEWVGGLRDRMVRPDADVMPGIEAGISSVVQDIKRNVFPIHNIQPGL